MNFNNYQALAKRTANYAEVMKEFTDASAPDFKLHVLSYVTLGLTGEAGELANKVKKVMRDDNGRLTFRRRQQLTDELGDCLWYISEFARQIGVDLEDVAQHNLYKLQAREANGTLHGDGDKR